MIVTETALLQVEGLTKHFGGITALTDYDINIHPGELVGLIGPNGAGKTTVFNLLSGVLKPTSGRILFKGYDITSFRPDQNATLGIARTFQNIRLFHELSVRDNIKVAFHMHMGKGFWKTLFHTPGFRSSEKQMDQKVQEFLALLGLQDVQDKLAKNLPYGLQRRVEIARAMATSPQLLLLDEPAAGMNPHESEQLIGVIRDIHDNYHLTIFLVEHDMKVVMALCQRIQVIDRGNTLIVGSPREIRNHPEVIEAYLGKPKGRRHASD
jgi:branched-chain amino acid transport system ATP-binding protein